MCVAHKGEKIKARENNGEKMLDFCLKSAILLFDISYYKLNINAL